MAGYLISDTRKVTTHRFIEMKQKHEKISMLTSYDFTTAGIVDRAGIDGILVGDSASNVMAGNGTDGQILVVDDMLGKTNGFSPRFLRRYADLNTIMTDAIGHYVEDVKNCDFPNKKESY